LDFGSYYLLNSYFAASVIRHAVLLGYIVPLKDAENCQNEYELCYKLIYYIVYNFMFTAVRSVKCRLFPKGGLPLTR